MDGVSSLTFTAGACLVRYNPDAPESTIDDAFFWVRRIFHWFFRYFHMGEVLLGATHVMLHVYVGRVYNYV